MLTADNNLLNTKQRVVLALAFGTVLLIFFFTVDQAALSSEQKKVISDFLYLVPLIFSAGIAFFMKKSGLLNRKTVLVLIITCGFAMRLAYAVRFGYYENQHDVEGLTSAGHLSYIYKLALDGTLPNTNDWQYCHPPLHHFLASIMVRASLASGFSEAAAFENIQLLTVFYSTLCIFAGSAVIRASGAGENGTLWLTAILAFHPFFIILGGSINNDILCAMLMLYAVLYLVKWYKSPSVKTAAMCGLFTGLGMMTKFSAAMIAVSAAFAVFIKWITDKNLKFSKFILHTAVFSAFMLPLGMWYQIRNYLLFGQAIGYVAPIGTNNRLYIGDINVFKRLLLPFSGEYHGVYADVWNEYNLPQYFLRNSLFGEYDFGNYAAAALLVAVNALIVAFSVASLVLIIRKRKLISDNLPAFSVWFFQILSFVVFNIRYPFRCSMDFRYIVPTVVCGLIFLGAASQYGSNNDGGSAYTALKNVFKYLTVLFCALSAAVFL